MSAEDILKWLRDHLAMSVWVTPTLVSVMANGYESARGATEEEAILKMIGQEHARHEDSTTTHH